MNQVVKRMLIKVLEDTRHKIENDTCGLDEEELMSIANQLTHVKINIEQTCRHLNCSRATLNRMIADKRVPLPKKELGGKEYWYQDELDNYIANHK